MGRTWRRSMICRYQHQTDQRPGRGFAGQEILHKIQMDRRAGRWVYPQNMAASGVDGGDDVGDVLVDQICGWKSHSRHGSMLLPQRSQASLTAD